MSIIINWWQWSFAHGNPVILREMEISRLIDLVHEKGRAVAKDLGFAVKDPRLS